MPPAQPVPQSPPRFASGVPGSRAVRRILPGGAELGPDVIGVRGPLGVGESGDLQLIFAQRAVAVGADVLDTRPAELQNRGPGPGLDRHAQPPQTDTAA